MEPAPAATHDRQHPGTTGPIGVALGLARNRLTSELVEAAMAGAADLGRDARIVRPGGDQSHLCTLLGIGNPDSFLPVFAATPSCPRIIWSGDRGPRRLPAGVLAVRLRRCARRGDDDVHGRRA